MKITHPNRTTILATATALSLGIGAIATTGIALAHHTVTLEVDGVTQPVSGFLTTVDDVLHHAGVQPKEHDEVAPHRRNAITDGDTIVVRTAYPYTVTNSDGEQQTIWSTANSYAQVLENLGGGTILAADRSNARQALPLISAPATITINVDNKKLHVDAKPGDDIHTIIANAGITLTPIDRLRFDHNDEGLSLIVQRVTRGNVTTTDVIEKPVEEREDDTLYEGETSIIDEGQDGQIVTTTYVETIDGHTSVQAIHKQQRTEPTPQIVAKGTKQRPTPARTSSSSATAPSQTVNLDGVWAALAQCESGGNPSTNTGNGFYGLYQFSLPTWQAVGGSGLPSQASAEEQTKRAQILQQRAGWGQWPACSASLGLY